jgi:hypothetical protein
MACDSAGLISSIKRYSPKVLFKNQNTILFSDNGKPFSGGNLVVPPPKGYH